MFPWSISYVAEIAINRLLRIIDSNITYGSNLRLQPAQVTTATWSTYGWNMLVKILDTTQTVSQQTDAMEHCISTSERHFVGRMLIRCHVFFLLHKLTFPLASQNVSWLFSDKFDGFRCIGGKAQNWKCWCIVQEVWPNFMAQPA